MLIGTAKQIRNRLLGRRNTGLVYSAGAGSVPTLNELALSASTIAENSTAGSVIGAILNTTPGSILSIQSQENANWFAISGGNLVVGSANNDFEVDASATVTILETLLGAIGNPRATVLTVTITDVLETAPPAYVRSSVTTGGFVNNHTTTLPTVDGANGVLVASISWANGTISTATSGWSKVAQVASGSREFALFIASEGVAAPSFTTAGNGSIVCHVSYYKRVSGSMTPSTTPFSSAQSPGSTSITTPAITTTVVDALAVNFIMQDDAAASIPTPTNFTQDYNAATGPDCTHKISSRSLPTSGTSSGAVAVTSSSADVWAAFMLQLA